MANKAPVLRIINRVVSDQHHQPTAIRREQEPVIASVSSNDCGQIDERMDEDEDDDDDEDEDEESAQNSTSNLLKSSPSDSLNRPF